MPDSFFRLEQVDAVNVVRLHSLDDSNRLTGGCVLALTSALQELGDKREALIITGNERFFSAGADLSEIASLTGPAAYRFSQTGQMLMNTSENFPAPVYAAISGYCMGGGLDLALACHRRIASMDAVFGHRRAALGLITGWGGTQRLPSLVGKSRALQMLVAAEKVHAKEALQYGLIDAIAKHPVSEAAARIRGMRENSC